MKKLGPERLNTMLRDVPLIAGRARFEPRLSGFWMCVVCIILSKVDGTFLYPAKLGRTKSRSQLCDFELLHHLFIICTLTKSILIPFCKSWGQSSFLSPSTFQSVSSSKIWPPPIPITSDLVQMISKCLLVAKLEEPPHCFSCCCPSLLPGLPIPSSCHSVCYLANNVVFSLFDSRLTSSCVLVKCIPAATGAFMCPFVSSNCLTINLPCPNLPLPSSPRLHILFLLVWLYFFLPSLKQIIEE